jgi:Spy/CpxP family protein refolding chaperone
MPISIIRRNRPNTAQVEICPWGGQEEVPMTKRVFTALAVLFMSAGVAVAAQQSAAQKPHVHLTIDQQVAKLQSTYNLTDEQTAQAKAWYNKFEDVVKTWKQNNPGYTPAQIHAMDPKWLQERADGLKKIMTADQWKQFQADMAKRRQQMQKRQAPPPSEQ